MVVEVKVVDAMDGVVDIVTVVVVGDSLNFSHSHLSLLLFFSFPLLFPSPLSLSHL